MSVLVRHIPLGASPCKSHKSGVRALARYVERAVRTRDRAALKGLYRLVLREETSISPYLACTLGLADQVAEPDVLACAGSDADPTSAVDASALLIPEWRSLYPPHGEVPRAAITRHLLCLGETGSGKTLSAILPVVAAMARAPREQVSGGLIIDPKHELEPILRGLVGDDLQHLDRSELVLDLMDAPHWRVDDDVAAKRWVTVATSIMLRMRGFALASPLRVLGPHVAGSSNSEFFDREGCALLRDVIAFLLMLFDVDAPPVSEWLPQASSDSDSSCDAETPPDPTDPRRWVHALHARARGFDGKRGVNIVALAAWVLGTPLVQVADDGTPWLWAQLAAAALPVFGAQAGEARDLLERVRAYWRKSAQTASQHMGVVASARNASNEFAAPSVERTIFFGCEPGLAWAAGMRVDLSGLVACGGPDVSGPRFVPLSTCS